MSVDNITQNDIADLSDKVLGVLDGRSYNLMLSALASTVVRIILAQSFDPNRSAKFFSQTLTAKVKEASRDRH
jgi:hypothetical protein